MTEKEYTLWESEAVKRGYKVYYTTSSSNEYSYFKTIGKTDDGYKYMIEWRVWNWHKYADRDSRCKEHPYSLDVNIMPDSCRDGMRLDMLIGDPIELGFDKVEEVAERYYQFLEKEGLVK